MAHSCRILRLPRTFWRTAADSAAAHQKMCEAGDIGAFFAGGPSRGRGGVAGEGSASGALVGTGTDEAGALAGAGSASALVGAGAEAAEEAWLPLPLGALALPLGARPRILFGESLLSDVMLLDREEGRSHGMLQPAAAGW